MKTQSSANQIEQNEHASSVAQTETKKLRTGLKIRTRIKAGDDADYRTGSNHGLKIRTAR